MGGEVRHDWNKAKLKYKSLKLSNMPNSKSPVGTTDDKSTNVDGEIRQAQIAQKPMLCAVITKNLPNKRCVLNNYIGTPLEARNVGSRYIQLKLKKYTNWFSVPIDYVSIL